MDNFQASGPITCNDEHQCPRCTLRSRQMDRVRRMRREAEQNMYMDDPIHEQHHLNVTSASTENMDFEYCDYDRFEEHEIDELEYAAGIFIFLWVVSIREGHFVDRLVLFSQCLILPSLSVTIQ